MTIHTKLRRAAAAALGLGLALALAACFVVPGQFASTLDLRKDGTFTFAYKGEIFLLGVSQLSQLAHDADGKAEFTPSPCFDEDNDWAERDCTEDELAQQRDEWDASQASSAQDDEKTSQAMAAMFGGVDPSDPQAAEEIAAHLRRQHGWNSVTYKGNGVYDVDFAITSRMSHDFTFPTLEGFPLSNAFVTATLREGNVVRIDAPGFVARPKSSGSSAGMLQMLSIFGTPTGDASDELGKYPTLQGTFAITTDAAILANNTDEGPKPVAKGQQLDWTITGRSEAPPMALIKLGN